MKRNKIYLIVFTMMIITILIPKFELATENSVIQNSQVEVNKQDVFKDISAPHLMLTETNSGKVLYERKADEKIYPASLTKLMTAIIVVENCDLNDYATVSEKAVRSVPSGYVNARLQIDEKLKVRDLLYAMLIPSANDAANVLAEHTAGSIESFATMMNTKARELGCTGSNFTNPSGLHEESHYTTTRDMCLIARNAISNNTVKTIIGTEKYVLPKSNKYNRIDRVLTTTNYLKRKELSKYYYSYCIGAKTGYTGEAKNCVVEFAKKDDIELTAIVVGENAKIKGTKFLDTIKMFEYGFSNYQNKKVAVKGETYNTIKIKNATKDTRDLKVLFKSNINILIPKNNTKSESNIEETVEYYNINAPIKKGDIIGKITYKYDNLEYTTDLSAGSNVEKSDMLRIIFYVSFLILVIFIIHNYKKSNKKRKKYRKHGERINMITF